MGIGGGIVLSVVVFVDQMCRREGDGDRRREGGEKGGGRGHGRRAEFTFNQNIY